MPVAEVQPLLWTMTPPERHLEALRLDPGAELVGFAGHQGHALLARAGGAGRGAVALQDDSGLFPAGPPAGQ